MKLIFVTHWANNMLIFRTWMLEEAVRLGHEVLVLCPPDKEASHFARLGVRYIPWCLKRGGGAVNMLASVQEAHKVIRFEKPDSTVVYCVQPIMALLWAWKLGGRSGRLYPTFTGLGSLWTDLDEPTLKKRMIRGFVERVFGRLLPQAHKVFVLNRDDKAQVASWNSKRLVAAPGILGVNAESFLPKRESLPWICEVVQTMGEGVDLQHFQIPTSEERMLARSRWNIPPDAKVIGFVGRLIREKGAPDFLALCRELHNDPTIHFLVVGDPDKGNPTSLTEVELLELDAVPRMHRERWMNNVRPAYAAMDILVFLSAREGMPITPLEAMAMGVPVVGYDAVGTREIVPGDWLVPAGRSALLHGLLANPPVVRQVGRQYDRAIIQGALLSEFANSVENFE